MKNKEEYSGEFGEFIETKDNPVPSLDINELTNLFNKWLDKRLPRGHSLFDINRGSFRHEFNEFTKFIIQNGVETSNEQPENSLTFDEKDLKPLYYLLSRTNSRKYMEELDVFLERIAFIIG